MDSDSDKENYFSLYMKKKKSDVQKKVNFRSNKRFKNKSISSQKLKDSKNIKNTMKLLLESSDKKHKNTFSFVKSYLINFKDNKNKNKHSNKNKNITIEKIKKKEKNNESANDFKKYLISSPKTDYEINNDDKSDNNQKIETLKNRIFNLMNVIENFEINFINNKKPLQIKEQFDKIKYKITPNNLKINIDKKPSKTCKNSDKNENINFYNNYDFYEDFSKTERINYAPGQKLKNNNTKIINAYTKIYEDFNNIKNLDNLDNYNKNGILTKRINGRQHSAVNQRISSDNNIAIILLNKQKNNGSNNNKQPNNNSTFLNLISSNIITKNELKKVNSNFPKNKSKSLVNKMKTNSISNKTLYKNDKNENIDEKEKKQNIFKRRINYSNFINQKMKQNIIIHRNKGHYLKPNMINKSKFGNKSNGCNTCFDMNHNDNYVKNLLNKNSKSKSIDKNNMNVVNSVNNINPINI